MQKLYFYTVSDDYIRYLSSYEKKICFNKGKKRPYIGIVFKVGYINYFAPFSSPKPKHIKMKDYIDYIKIDNGRLGVINFNNMIPIPLEVCRKVELKDVGKSEYEMLLLNQYRWCNKPDNYNRIINTANKLYYRVINKTINKAVLDRCCDYKLLEDKYFQYSQQEIITNISTVMEL